MKLNPINPRKALNMARLKTKPTRSQLETFKQNLAQLFEQITETESEEFHKNPFAKQVRNLCVEIRFVRLH